MAKPSWWNDAIGGNYVDENGVIHITVGPTKPTDPPQPTTPPTPSDPLNDMLKKLFGVNTNDIWQSTEPLTPNTNTDAQGDNVIPGPTSLNGVFTQEWLNAHWQELLFGIVVLLLVIFGISATVRSTLRG